MEKNSTITIRTTSEFRERVKEAAKKENRNLSNLIRVAINKYISK